MHVSLGTEAASQLNLNVFRKETTIEQNKQAIQLLQENGIVAEAQFIMGLEAETPETIEETFKLALDWNPDMANWNMYTPWPFAELFEELGDRVEVRDYSKYNFVTPIMKPDAMEREDVLKGVLHSYARFYMRKSFLDYPFIKDPHKRRYMLGCLKAFAKTTLSKRFYDLGRVQRKGFQLDVDLQFDKSRILSREEIAALKAQRPDLSADVIQTGNLGDISVCGAPRDLEYHEDESNGSSMADISACGAPRDLEYHEEDEIQPPGMSMKI
jgi:anaerobic magnesium-protoporphyrin IX monomethyl ester cyclase